MISIFTPTHNPQYIYELYNSIKKQTYTDWEWIILVNNGAKVDIKDSKVKVIESPFNSKSIGFLKKFACLNCSGDILLEADHDDLLTSTALEETAKAFEDKEIGFVYSNNAKLTDDFIPYNPLYGWDYRKFEWEGKDYIEMIGFEPTAHSFAFIWYAPDHLRAWRKSVYFEIGGHNDELDVCDDHDLLIKTYLKTKIKFINKCLYLYRITGNNTWLEKNQNIQNKTVELFNKYAFRLAERHAELNNLLKIDLGGGFNKPEGYISIDLENGDIKANLNEKWPLEDNSVGVLRAFDIFEHLADKQHVMSEAHRVLADGGWLMAQIPSTDGRGAFQDPTHISYWNENSIWYWTRADLMKYIRNEKIKFQEFRLNTCFPSDWHKENNISYITAYLSAIKSEARRPHIIL